MACAQRASSKVPEGQSAAPVQPTSEENDSDAATQGNVLVDDFGSKEAVHRANAAKADIMVTIQSSLPAYKDGKIENNELETRSDPYPENSEFSAIETVDDFRITPGNEMFDISVSLSASKNTMHFYLSQMGPTIGAVLNGTASEDDIFRPAKAVGI